MTQEYLTVSALNKYIKRKFDVDPYLERIYLTGEISNFRLRPNNHQYFSLKDEQSKISAIMFKGAFQKLKFVPKEGMKVLVVGRVALYEASGMYQIYIEHMEPDGVGALYQALAELKEKLNNEGLFSLPKKRLPRFPKRIAVLTSPSGAVIRDIITTVKRRYPIAQLVLFPTVVQGDKAAENIVKNIKQAESGEFDTMIIGRGGGSIEDLWPFNEEVVARAIASSTIPTISSVGHETDITIADLVADVRAATPTAAAELAVPVLSEELLRLKEKQGRLEKAYLNQLERKKERYQRIMQSYIFRQPMRLYEAQSIQLDRLTQRLQQETRLLVNQREKKLLQAISRFEKSTPLNRVKNTHQQLDYLITRLKQQMSVFMEQKEQAMAHSITSLDLLSPLKIMGRGYTYTTQNDQVIRSVDELNEKNLTIHFVDGTVTTTIDKIIKKGEE
ncbi:MULTISPECIES: exodeoxyribonuclease VII large subunit [Enterococcus]|uniref:Exodeoxyribonuclease 7 large subunit n=1 Tax=Candidatus Enterococcus ferrettii TaxID=2815324 RepID=A0ABV0EWP4_9ENTE|nr:exodeoxyribonuclease VII large subunit [Enterococcus sp. 665A]MBO1338841.1 exodeoxyribonuclease VII large subunit [Enterococcus sp. 665A]